MVARKEAAPAAGGKDTVVSTAGDTDLVLRQKADTEAKAQKAGDAGPPSSLETRVGSPTGASAGGQADFEGRRGAPEAKGQAYDVQVHTADGGVEVERVTAESGDEAALKVRKGRGEEGFKGCSIRGVTPASDPDPNSLGGEREASIMLYDAENQGEGLDPLGTPANREASRELRKADVKELGE